MEEGTPLVNREARVVAGPPPESLASCGFACDHNYFNKVPSVTLRPNDLFEALWRHTLSSSSGFQGGKPEEPWDSPAGSGWGPSLESLLEKECDQTEAGTALSGGRASTVAPTAKGGGARPRDVLGGPGARKGQKLPSQNGPRLDQTSAYPRHRTRTRVL